jgi:signal peptidase I
MTDRGPYDYGPPDRGPYQRGAERGLAGRDPYGRDPNGREPAEPYAQSNGGDQYGGEGYPRDPYAREPAESYDPYGRHRSGPYDGRGRYPDEPYEAGPRYEGGNRYDDGRRGYDPGRRAEGRARPPAEVRRAEAKRAQATRAEDRRREGERESLRSRARQVRKNMPLWQELPLLLIVAFCLAVLVRTFLVQAFFIPSGSMEDTLLVGDRVLVNKIVYDVRQPERGEIVVFRGPDNWVPENAPDPNVGFFAKLGRTVGDLVGVSQPGEKDFIKRVIGLPGDEVSCCDVNGNVLVNGTPLDEPYVHENSPADAPPVPRECRSRKFGPITVEPGQMWVMGDHRLVSQDSRCQGQVPIDNVIGRAFVIVWPSSRWAGLGVPSTFAHVERRRAAADFPGLRGDVPAIDRTAPEGAFVAPIIVSLVVPARSRRIRRRRRRTLLP